MFVILPTVFSLDQSGVTLPFVDKASVCVCHEGCNVFKGAVCIIFKHHYITVKI